MVIDKLAEYLSNADGENPSLRGMYSQLLEELHQFVRQELPSGGVRYAADYGCHDDLVMSLAITMWVLFENAELSAPIADDSGKREVIKLTKMYEIRQRNIEEAERIQQEAWDSFVLSGGSYYI